MCVELLRHLKDEETSRDYIRCRNSIYLIGKIINYNEDRLLNHIPSWNNQLAFFFTARYVQKQSSYDISVIEYLQELIKSDLSAQTIRLGVPNYKSLEKDWIYNRNILIQGFLSIPFSELNSEISILGIVLQVIKFSLNFEYFYWEGRRELLLKLLQPVSSFYNSFLLSIINGLSIDGNKVASNPDHERWNSISDIMIMISCLLSKVILISNDTKIINCFINTENHDKLIETKNYISSLDLN